MSLLVRASLTSSLLAAEYLHCLESINSLTRLSCLELIRSPPLYTLEQLSRLTQLQRLVVDGGGFSHPPLEWEEGWHPVDLEAALAGFPSLTDLAISNCP